MNSADIALALLVEYQFWAREPVVLPSRASTLVADLVTVCAQHSKADAVKFLLTAGWTDQTTTAKRLVDRIWVYRPALKERGFSLVDTKGSL